MVVSQKYAYDDGKDEGKQQDIYVQSDSGQPIARVLWLCGCSADYEIALPDLRLQRNRADCRRLGLSAGHSVGVQGEP